MPFLFGFKTPRRRDDDDSLREFLVLHEQWMRDRRLRTFFVHALVASGVVTWIAASDPTAFSPEIRRYALLAWALLFVAAVASGLSEWVTRRRFEREAEALGDAVPDELRTER